jgi:hypothetical protein
MKAIEQGVAQVRMPRAELFTHASIIIKRAQEETTALMEAGLIPMAE